MTNKKYNCKSVEITVAGVPVRGFSEDEMVSNNDALEDLGQRAVACEKHFRWMPGMLAVARREPPFEPVIERRDASWHLPYPGSIPDMSDPATLGCMLHLAREAYSDPGLSCTTASYSDGVYLSRVVGGHHHGITFQAMSQQKYSSEAEALVAALEAAP